MARSRRRSRIATLAGATSVLLLTAAGMASPAFARPPGSPPTLGVDCFGVRIDTWTVLTVPAGGQAFVGTTGDDVIMGTSGPDRIFGNGGDDTICGRDGDDYILGDSDDDSIDGEGGRDEIHGGDGDDRIYGGPNPPDPARYHEALYGDDGSDVLFGENGPDALICGAHPVGGYDYADGGTGMANGAPEDDYLSGPADCTTIVDVP